MAQYDSDRWQILSAAAMASASALVLSQYPIARNLALMIGTLVSNPGDMAKAAKEWEAPADGQAGMDFESIKTELVRLKKEIEEKGYWKGPAWMVFSEAVDQFAEQLDVTSAYFKGVGGGMDHMATLYHWAVQVAVYVAFAMALAAVWEVASYFIPVAGKLTARVTISGFLTALGQALRNVVSKKVKSVAMLTGVLVMVNGMCAMMTQSIDKGRPKPDFAPTAVEYAAPTTDGAPGTLQRKNGGMPSMNLPGGGLI
ncbi:hypothetical protein ABT158_37625 [Nonomuraea sp. NPDC001636]|uniref:hypothetical protein n=1 Tax=Nonomuraea sp. NPDC001636 TaxID=3154391 RepID=UPI0033293103